MKIEEKLLEAINKQITYEFESAHLYLSMVAYFHDHGLDGMAHWMRCQAHEEMIHGMKFYDYIIERGSRVTLKDLHLIKNDWQSPLDAWRDAYLHEQKITGNINDLISLARELKDYAAEPLLAWFAEEQIEEEASTAKVAEQLEMIGDNKHGYLLLDRELGSRAFPLASPFDPVGIKNA